MASATVTEKGVEVVFDPTEVTDRQNPADQDDAGIERALASALELIGMTTKDIDDLTFPEPWVSRTNRVTKEEELVQCFVWRADIPEGRVEKLRTHAGEAGDLAMVAVCERALAGEEGSRVECARVIQDAMGRAIIR